MKFDGVDLLQGSITAATIENGTTLPQSDLRTGRMFYLTAIDGEFSPGMHIYNGSGWDVINTNIIELLDAKDSVRVGTTQALPTNTASGTGEGKTLTADANGALTIDGVAVALNDRILVKNEASGENNGVYFVTTVGDGSTAWELTRTLDADDNTQLTSGLFCFVEEGTLLNNSGWILSTSDPITIDTTPLSFVQFSTGGSIPTFLDGSASNPGITFSDDLNTGLHRPADDTIGITAGGADKLTITASEIDASVHLDMNSNQIKNVDTPTTGTDASNKDYVDTTHAAGFADGDPTSPGIKFLSDTNTGMYRTGADAIGFSTNSLRRMEITTSDIDMTLPIDMNANKITELGTPTAGTDAATKDYVDTTHAGGFADGAAGAPSISFLNDLDTGLFLNAANEIAMSTNGTARFILNDTRLELSGGNLHLHAYEANVPEQGIFFRSGFTNPASTGYNCSILTYDHSGAGEAPDGLSINGYDGISFSTGSNTRNQRMLIDQSGDVYVATGQLYMPNGSAATPSYSFTNDSDSGFYSNGANQINIGIGGTHIAHFDGNGLHIPNQKLYMSDGSAAVPSIRFSNDTDTGIFSPGVGSLSITTGGVHRVEIDTLMDVKGMRITGVGDPTADTDAVNKSYVDGIASGLDLKESVRAATTTNITLSGAQTIDSVSVVAGDRVLVKNQSTASENGIYIAASGAWTRSEDTDGTPSNEVTTGMFTFAEEGGQAGTGWVLITAGAITVGTTGLSFTQFSENTIITGGTGINVLGQEVSFDTTFGDNRYLNQSGDTMTGTLRLVDGSASSPSVSFGTDTNTGMYKYGGDVLGFAAGGSHVARVTSGGLVVDGSNGLRNISGSAATPAYSFSGDVNSGMYSPAGDVLGFGTNGLQRVTIDAQGLTTHTTSGSSWGASNTNVSFDTKTPNNTSATWLLGHHNTDNSFRSGIQSLNNGGRMRLYAGSNYVELGDYVRSSFNGSATTPAYSFISDTDTGMYLSATGVLNFTTAGTSRMSIGAAAINANLPLSMNGQITLQNNGAESHAIVFQGNPDAGADVGIKATGESFIIFEPEDSDKEWLRIDDDPDTLGTALKVGGHTVWHDGNDGSGSGLDADFLDGHHASAFIRANASDTTTGTLRFNVDQAIASLPAAAAGTYGQMRITSGNNGMSIGLDSVTNSRVGWIQVGHESSSYPLTSVQGDLELNPEGGTVRINGNRALTVADEGSGNGLDADTVDGLQASQFLRADANDTASGIISLTSGSQYPLQIAGGNDGKILLSGASSPYIRFQEGSSDKAYIQWNSSVNAVYIRNQEDGSGLRIRDDIEFTQDGSTFYNVWHANNDGSGSGLDADRLDGLQASSFVRSDAADTKTGSLTFQDSGANLLILRNTANGGGAGIQFSDHSSGSYGQSGTLNFYHSDSQAPGGSGYGATFKFDTNEANLAVQIDGAGDFFVGSSKVWHAGNDGSGSGLDADTLDGQHGSYYAQFNHFRSLGSNTITTGSGSTITTAEFVSELDAEGAFDSYMSCLKTSWSYAGNDDISDGGTHGPSETAGMSFLTWTDNASDSARGNVTILAVAPNAGASSGGVYIYNDQGPSYNPGWREVWTSATDGSGSGLDADLLDGLQGSSYVQTSGNQTINGTKTFTSDIYMTGARVFGDGKEMFRFDDAWLRINDTENFTSGIYCGSNTLRTDGQFHIGQDGATLLVNGSTFTHQGNTVWTSGNDGSGSGLDADLLDGQNRSESSTGSTVVSRNSSGDINARLFRSEYDTTNATVNYIMTQIDTASNNYIRPTTPAQFRAAVTDGHYPSLSATQTFSGTTTFSAANTYFTGARLYGDAKEMIRYDDTWLRINDASQFASGVYIEGNAYFANNIRAHEGTESSPGIQFNGDVDTGIYQSALDHIDFTTGGTTRMQLNSSGQLRFGNLSSVFNGSASVPLISFGANADTGIYSSSTDRIDFSAGGVRKMYISSASVVFPEQIIMQDIFRATDGSATSPAICFNSDIDTGMYKLATNQMAFACGGQSILRCSTSGTYLTKHLTTSNAANCWINSSGGLMYRSTSSIKYKKDILPIDDEMTDKLLASNPITYHSKIEHEDDSVRHVGFIAEELHDAGLTELVQYENDQEGEPESVNYERVTAILTKIVQNQQTQLDQQAAMIEQLQQQIDNL